MTDVVLIVDDEDAVRRTMVDWLTEAGLGLTVLAADDAETALLLADKHAIDLAVLDWNLGSGADGLRLLEDLVEFQPDLTAILVTGFAGQATPLEALRMGVRDYLDKNQDLTRATFLKAVERQLVKIRPAKRQRELNRTLADFRDAVQKVLPLVRSASAFNDPVPLPAAVHTLFRFLLRATGAPDGVLLVRYHDAHGMDDTTAYAPSGEPLPHMTVPFARSLAAGIAGMQDPVIMNDFTASPGLLELLPVEQNRKSILAAPVRVGPGMNVVLELFDKPVFTEDDRRLVAAATDLGADLLKQALAERQTQRLLFDAVDAALTAGEAMSRTLADDGPARPRGDSTNAAMEQLRAGLASDPNAIADGDTTLKLIQAVRDLALIHGPSAVDHCVTLIRDLRRLLDEVTGRDV